MNKKALAKKMAKKANLDLALQTTEREKGKDKDSFKKALSSYSGRISSAGDPHIYMPQIGGALHGQCSQCGYFGHKK